MHKTAVAGVIAALLSLVSVPAAAVDGIAIEAGNGDSTNMGRVAVQWDWNKRWFQGAGWHVGGYWDLGLGYWHNNSAVLWQNSNITEIGLTPVFRLQRNELKGVYLEAGIGVHLLSETQIGNKQFSTAFQFGDHLGVGYRFGTRGAWDLSYRFQHLSNADIKKPNNGINFSQARLQYHYQ